MGTMHTYSHEELHAFTQFINEFLQGDPDLQGVLSWSPRVPFDVFMIRSLSSTLSLSPSPSKPINSSHNILVYLYELLGVWGLDLLRPGSLDR